MYLTYPGHSCILLEGSRRILIDPFIPSGELPPDADLICVTHAHADHLGETVTLKKPTVAPNELAKYLIAKGVPAEALNIGGGITVDGIHIVMTQAIHSSWLEDAGGGYYGGSASGYVIRMDGITVYHAGDTALFSDMKLIGDLYHPDVALLPIGGRFTMGPDEAMIAASYIGAPLVIPIHYNTWEKIEQDPIRFKNAIEKTTDMKVAVLAPGDRIDLSDTKGITI
ncbi:metal-dependent hydrolase [Methanocalculus sp.]|uniref:metal-dependent hydrolase n=1 Tax=Methanocalculus sp. TaxID=2004547 RepID=UPI00271BBDEA|nr:metal-dependent hydrolase [Methanocalculus sp.]MDO8841253.1 metal-dependent hydrolase [Methanocalculus sp.]